MSIREPDVRNERAREADSPPRLQSLKAQVASRELRRRRAETRAIWGGRVAIVAGTLLLWELLSGRVIDPFFVSSPSRVYAAFLQLLFEQELLVHAWYTTLATLGGFFFGSITAIVLAFLVTSVNRLYETTEPLLAALYGIPRTALAPLFIMWFGIGITSKIVIAALFVFFVVFINTVSGIRGTGPQLINLARLMGARDRDVLLKVVLPSAMPYILTALRIVVPTAMIGAIVGEFISAQRGLGFLISRATFEFSTHAAFAGIFVLMLVVVAMNAVIGWIERPLLRWRPRSNVGSSEGG
ncbi:MAG: ABC transporter permease [Armatimonadetes bacterium]|nr:ABC transporter permease [Armatimonadota bacterium]